MSGTTILQVAIGLVLVYLVFSLFCSAIQEWIARLLALRAKTLRAAIEQYLGAPVTPNPGNPPGGNVGNVAPPPTIAQLLNDHPLITSLFDEKRRSKVKYPTYIPTQHFVMALLDVAFTQDPNTSKWSAATPTSPVGKLLNTVITGVENDTALVQQRLGKWFDDSMERVSGIYKRQAHAILLVIALLVAALLNIDTIGIVQALWTEPTLRSALDAQAAQIVMKQSTDAAKPKPAIGGPQQQARDHRDTTATVAAAACKGSSTAQKPDTSRSPEDAVTGIDLSCQMAALTRLLPVGWRTDCPDVGVASAGVLRYQCVKDYTSVVPIAIKALGFVLTIIALSLGAPFWFDTLSRISNLRQTGTPPDDINKRQPAVVT